MQPDKDFLPPLTPASIRPLLAALAVGVVGPGLLPALRDYPPQGDAGRTAASLAHALSEGLDWASALMLCRPALPEALIELLALGAQQGRLDEFLDQILTELDKADLPEDALHKLDQLQQRLATRPDSPLICAGCLERELDKIIRRAQTEKASAVILQQEGERYLHQKYLAAKLVHIIEASHSKTYTTLLAELSSRAAGPDSLWLAASEYRITPRGPASFLLTGPQNFSLQIEFRP